jgi:cytochrome c
MDAFEYNKIAGAVLSALLVAFGCRTLRDLALQEPKPEKPGWVLPVTQTEPGKTGPTTQLFDPAEVMALLPKASADNGRDVFKRCLQCHTAEKGAPHRVGPNLWGIVNRPRAAASAFPYSEAMKNHPGNWTFIELAKYLHDPKTDIAGNKMAFAGIKDNAELADLLAYLRTLSDSPAPLPE